MANDRPLTPQELKRLKPEPATEPEPVRERVIATTFLSGPDDLKPQVSSRLTRIHSARGATSWQVDLTTNLPDIATSPPPFELWPVKRAKRRQVRDGDDYRPPWAAMRFSPQRVRQPKVRVLRGDRELDPLTVFPPDGRNVYFDTSFPWRCVCRVDTTKGSGSGVLIGRRLVLTASCRRAHLRRTVGSASVRISGVDHRGFGQPRHFGLPGGERRRTRGTRGRDPGRYIQMVEDARDRRALFDKGDQAKAATTPGTGQHVEAERPPHQVRPEPVPGVASRRLRRLRRRRGGLVLRALTMRRQHGLGARGGTTVLRRRVPHDGGPPRRAAPERRGTESD